METPVSRVRGLGSAKHGAQHWWGERMMSVATLLLFAWFLASLLMLPSLDYRGVTEWLRSPLAAVPMLLLIVTTFWHLRDGMQVIIDDYAHQEGNRFFLIMLLNFLTIAAAAVALFSVLKIAFGGEAGANG